MDKEPFLARFAQPVDGIRIFVSAETAFDRVPAAFAATQGGASAWDTSLTEVENETTDDD